MKRYGNLFNQITEYDNLLRAHSNARKGKTKYCHGGSNQCLTLEVVIDGLKHVVFSGSGVLIEQMTKYGENIPFIATIVKINKYYRLK